MPKMYSTPCADNTSTTFCALRTGSPGFVDAISPVWSLALLSDRLGSEPPLERGPQARFFGRPEEVCRPRDKSVRPDQQRRGRQVGGGRVDDVDPIGPPPRRVGDGPVAVEQDRAGVVQQFGDPSAVGE